MEHTYENALAWRRKQSRRAWRPFFRSASADEKKCYEAVWEGLTRRDAVIPMPVNDPAIAEKALHQCLDDDPVLFDTGPIELAISAAGTNMLVTYAMDEQQFTDTIMAVRNAVTQLKRACRNKSRSDSIRYLHDYFVQNIRYDRSDDPAVHEAWLVFKEHRGVCDGISKAVKILLDSCHIPSRIIKGKSQGEGHEDGHAWNLIEENGTWYHYDFTFDNTLSEGSEDIHYDYYRLSESQIRRDHEYTDVLSVPPAAQEDDWFRQNNCYFTSKKKLREYIRSCMNSHRKSFTFRLPYTKDPLVTRDSICTLVKEELEKTVLFTTVYSVSFNERQMVMMIRLQ